MAEPLIMWVVYLDPDDFPGEFVARKWQTIHGKATPLNEVIRARIELTGKPEHVTTEKLMEFQLKAIRKGIEKVMPGAHCFPRSESDDRAVYETWF